MAGKQIRGSGSLSSRSSTMPDFFCNKVKTATSYALVPAHQQDEELIKKLPAHKPFRCKVTQIRNVDHHRKYFALLNYCFDVWEPPSLSNEDKMRACKLEIMPADIEKNFDRFRKDIVILCGFYDTVVRVNGDLQFEAKSISFAKMGQDEFEILYDKTIDVMIKHVCKNYSGDELRDVIDQVMEFDS